MVPLFCYKLTGKQHGSLARAGKVRGQTPKVEKQDSKKKVTGRAKRRIQYNRCVSPSFEITVGALCHEGWSFKFNHQLEMDFSLSEK